MKYEEQLETAINAAKKGGEVLKKYWGKLKHIESKGYSWDLVTEADKESEKVVIDFLKNAYPSYAILSEEAGMIDAKDSSHLWCIDPLDGTTNYTHMYPMVAVAISLIVDGESVVGVTYNPILNELFSGAQGSGAFCNGVPMTVSSVLSLDMSLLVTGFPYDRRETRDTNYREFCHLTHLSQGVRRAGSAAIDLAYVAAGRLDGYWERGLNPWDISAGILLVKEAGGMASNYDGSPYDIFSGRVLATNGHIHPALSEEIMKARSGNFSWLE